MGNDKMASPPPEEMPYAAGQDSDDKYTCFTCIGDQFLSDEVKNKGTLALCSYCDHSREAFSLDELADRIDKVLQEHFERVTDEPYWLHSLDWPPDGERVLDVISEIANLREEIAEDLADLLSGRFHYWAVKEGGDDPYDSETYYQERSPDDWNFHYSWKSFCNEIMYRERIFPENAEPVLQEIFGNLSTLKTYDGTPVVREIIPSEEFPIWRARTAQSDKELIEILENPTQHLGPPPHSLTQAGRMNQKSIPVFYGALEEATCVAEVRPPVGSRVVLGKFSFSRPVRLLDLDTFSKIYVDVSHFDPDYTVLHGRASFIRSLVAEISKPIMPQDADREYLPTQFVASYLAHKMTPTFDGIIFPSSQTKENGQNVVLFNHARGVEKYEPPKGSEVEVYISSFAEEDDSVFVSETIPVSAPDNEFSVDEPQKGPIRVYDDEPGEPDEDIPSTLKLDLDSVKIFQIQGVTYTPKKLTVTRHRQTTKERDDFSLLISDTDWNDLLDVGGQNISEATP